MTHTDPTDAERQTDADEHEIHALKAEILDLEAQIPQPVTLTIDPAQIAVITVLEGGITWIGEGELSVATMRHGRLLEALLVDALENVRGALKELRPDA